MCVWVCVCSVQCVEEVDELLMRERDSDDVDVACCRETDEICVV